MNFAVVVVAALMVHSAHGCTVIVDSIYNFADVFDAKKDYNSKEWKITFNEDFTGISFKALLEDPDSGDNSEVDGDLCNFEKKDDEGIIADLSLRTFGAESICEPVKGLWMGPSTFEVPDDTCDSLLAKVPGEQIFLNIDLYREDLNIGAIQLAVRSEKWKSPLRG